MSGKPGQTPGVLVPQKHGGALYQGPTPRDRHVPGTGRPPSVIRQQLRGSFAERIAVLERIADSDDATNSDRAKAIDIMAKYGLGEVKVDEGLIRELGEEMAAEVRALPGGEDALQRVLDRWKSAVARRL